MRLAQKVGLQGIHIDALTCSYFVDFVKIKNGCYPAGLVTEIKKPVQSKQSREPLLRGQTLSVTEAIIPTGIAFIGSLIENFIAGERLRLSKRMHFRW